MKWVYLAAILPAVALGAASRGSVTGSRFRADFVAPAQMSLKVMSPRGATVEIRANNKVLARGTIPFEYKPAQEGFVSVSVVLPSGKRWWGNSIRLKARTECDLFVAEPVEAAAPSAPSGPAKATGDEAGGENAPAAEAPAAPGTGSAPSSVEPPQEVSPPAEPGKAAPPPPPQQEEVPPPAAPKTSDQP